MAEKASYIKYRLEDDEEVFEVKFTEEERNSKYFANIFFGKAAEMVAFDDINGVTDMEMMFDGRKCEYAGWMPGMHICFEDSKNREIVWDGWYPEWDH